KCSPQPVREEPEVQSGIDLRRRFPFQVRTGKGHRTQAAPLQIGAVVQTPVTVALTFLIKVMRYLLVSGDPVSQAKVEIRKQIRRKIFIPNAPLKRRRREQSVLITATKLCRTIRS